MVSPTWMLSPLASRASVTDWSFTHVPLVESRSTTTQPLSRFSMWACRRETASEPMGTSASMPRPMSVGEWSSTTRRPRLAP